jgi:creatinine amidohydrolase
VTVRWADLRRDQVAAGAAAGAVVLQPVGALEQHGPHLPLGTDAAAAMEVCLRAAQRIDDPKVLVLPSIPWGVSPYWMGFAGTISIRPHVLLELVTDVCASVAQHGFAHLVIVNGHGGNDGLLQGAGAQAATPAFRVSVVSYWNLARDALRAATEFDGGAIGHAGEAETSIALHLQPEYVDMQSITAEQCVDLPIPRRRVAARFGVYEAPNPYGDAPDGVYGRATAANADKGKRIIEAAASGLAELIRSFGTGSGS